MKLIKLLLFEDIKRFRYCMSNAEFQGYQRKKILLSLTPILCIIVMIMQHNFDKLMYLPFAMAFMYKVPYLLLSLRHNQNCNQIVCAIPLWMNHIYALIEKNTIHNAIVNSLNEQTPKAIKKDLEQLITQIEANPDDKDAYLGFLSAYKIDGFVDIMLKLYEFRSLSKDKLKYEIRSLNLTLSKIETLKRQSQFKNEVFIGDTCTCFVIFIPCIYMTVISLMPSLFAV